jgi:CDP-diacylglycerol--inositol 3-phosphatidyltransferase
MAKASQSDPNIFLFVPNLIGYARIVLGIASLFYMREEPHIAMPLYWLSAFLDAFDGQAARYLDQGAGPAMHSVQTQSS